MDPVDYITMGHVFYSELLNALHENLGKRSLGWLFIRFADIDNNTIQLYCPRAGYAFNNPTLSQTGIPSSTSSS